MPHTQRSGRSRSSTCTNGRISSLRSARRYQLANEAVRTRYRDMGVEIIDMGQEQFAAYVRADYEKWLKVAREGNIVVE